MSIKVMTAVWSHSRHVGTDLLMLLALADFSDDEGNSFPSVPTLAAKCRMQPRNANRILAELKKGGELEVHPSEGWKGSNRYRIVLEGLRSAAGGLQATAGVHSPAGVHSRAGTPALECSKPLHRAAPKPLLNRQEPSLRRRNAPAIATDSAKPKLIPHRQLVAEGVSNAVATEFLALRSRKRAPLTPLAWAGIRKQVTLAGWSLDEALRKCVERDWRSFEATWVNTERLAGRRPTHNSVLHANDNLADEAP